MATRLKAADRTIGILRVDLDGLWTARDLSEFIDRLNDAYQRFGAVFVASTPAQIQRYRRSPWPPFPPVDDIQRSLETMAVQLLGPLTVHEIEYASPGFFEFLGSLNPLKVIADFITSWRHENTQRSELSERKREADMATDLEYERLRLAREAQQNKYRLELLDRLDRLPPPQRDALISRLVEEPQHNLVPVAADGRVRKVSTRQLAA